ncbi:MAG: hypothetical protein WDN28_04780 [Chthoniobacter sp.]
MIYSLKLETAFVLVGVLLIAAHALALFKPAPVQAWLRSFPRSRNWGLTLVTIAAVWFFFLVAKMDLGEFTNWRQTVLIATPIAWILTWKYVDEFLAVRALGMIVLLAAEPLLEAAFLRPEPAAQLLRLLVYVWIVFAMFWVGTPYTLRDQIAWITAAEKRWRAAALAGLAYGAVADRFDADFVEVGGLIFWDLEHFRFILSRHGAPDTTKTCSCGPRFIPQDDRLNRNRFSSSRRRPRRSA